MPSSGDHSKCHGASPGRLIRASEAEGEEHQVKKHWTPVNEVHKVGIPGNLNHEAVLARCGW